MRLEFYSTRDTEDKLTGDVIATISGYSILQHRQSELNELQRVEKALDGIYTNADCNEQVDGRQYIHYCIKSWEKQGFKEDYKRAKRGLID